MYWSLRGAAGGVGYGDQSWHRGLGWHSSLDSPRAGLAKRLPLEGLAERPPQLSSPKGLAWHSSLGLAERSPQLSSLPNNSRRTARGTSGILLGGGGSTDIIGGGGRGESATVPRSIAVSCKRSVASINLWCSFDLLQSRIFCRALRPDPQRFLKQKGVSY